LEHFIESAEIFSPNGKSIIIDAKKQNIAEINRRDLDKQIAYQATKYGAEIRVKTSFKEVTDNGVNTSDGKIDCKIIVDARGVSSIINKDRTGILSSAQYEVYANWIKKGHVEVYLDQKKYPGFFAWIIPSSNGSGKVGVAGRGINSAEVLEEFIKRKGSYSIIRKIFAPIWIKGPIDKFVSKNLVVVGDAAGQTKPTTAGGIFSCGMGGVLAGRAISKFLKSGYSDDLGEYQKLWSEKFGKEFEKQLLARKILERFDNDTVDKLFGSITPEILKDISNKEDFDFHTSSILKLLGIKGTLKAAQILMASEMKNLLS
jgi:flavin-dependent dehydrogenase